MAYLLDANVSIQAKNLHYGLDFCPAFWKWLLANNAAKRVFSIEKVGDELACWGDELTQWAAPLGNGFFLQPDPAVLPGLAKTSAWVTSQKYEAAAVSTFLQVAGTRARRRRRAGRRRGGMRSSRTRRSWGTHRWRGWSGRRSRKGACLRLVRRRPRPIAVRPPLEPPTSSTSAG